MKPAAARSVADGMSTLRVAYRLGRHEPVAYLACLSGFVAFFAVPLLTGALVKAILDGLASPDSSSPWGLLAVLVGLEAARWSGLVAVAIQWHGCWVGWHTVPRVNLLRSLVSDPGPAADDDPMLLAAMVELQGQDGARPHGDPLDREPVAGVEHLPPAPGPLVAVAAPVGDFRHWTAPACLTCPGLSQASTADKPIASAKPRTRHSPARVRARS